MLETMLLLVGFYTFSFVALFSPIFFLPVVYLPFFSEFGATFVRRAHVLLDFAICTNENERFGDCKSRIVMMIMLKTTATDDNNSRHWLQKVAAAAVSH